MPWTTRLLSLGVACVFVLSQAAFAQLTWGTGGTGGTGAWNKTNVNWWNGSSNVVWNNDAAIFAGTGGTVTPAFITTVTALTFNAPGYSLTDGWLQVPAFASTFPITTNEAATISSTMSEGGVDDIVLVKQGAAPLTVSGTNFLGGLQVNEGEYRVSGNSSLFFSDVTLADAPGIILTLGSTSSSTNIKSLSGSGILQPNNQARTVTVTLWNSATFLGVAQDNGSGILAVSVFAPNDNIVLGGTNTYSGNTTAQSGTLTLSGNGSALNSSKAIAQVGGTLRLDNSASVLPNRLSDTVEVTLQSGRLELLGHATTAVTENLGPLKFSNASTLSASQPGAADAWLVFASASRQSHGTISFEGNGRVKWTGMANDSTGIIGPYATLGNEWATVTGNGSAGAFSAYTSDLNTATGGDHVKLISGTTLSAPVTSATLNWENNTGSSGVLDLRAGNSLTLADGGFLSTGGSANQVVNGTLRSGSTELLITNRNALTISSIIGESTPGTILTKAGAGTLTLSGSNTYTGNTVIVQGILSVESDANLGAGSSIEFGGGTLRVTQSFTSNKGFVSSGTLDTDSNNVTFTGANTGSLSKTGSGTLTLTNPAKGGISISEGTVNLPNAATGSPTLNGGTLVATGSFSTLSLRADSTLDIGGGEAAVLNLHSFQLDPGSSNHLTVLFDIGSTAKDLWNIDTFSTFGQSSAVILFDFQNIGGAATGVKYALIDYASPSFPAPESIFAITPNALAEGWTGTFQTSSSGVSITFTAVPEPGTGFLLGAGLLALIPLLRKKSSASSG